MQLFSFLSSHLSLICKFSSCRHFEAVEARFLRASFSAFVDILTLATKTIEEFSPGTEL